MFCKHCGKENPPKSSFCGSCGKPLEKELTNKPPKKYIEFINKFKELPKKTKIIMLTVFLVVLIALIVLIILLNNPVKNVEDNLASYYDSYKENRTKELLEIEKIIRKNKDNLKVLNNIEETIHSITSKWVKNFNTSYKNIDALEQAYKKTSSALTNLYNYYKGLDCKGDYYGLNPSHIAVQCSGLDYTLDYEAYSSYMEELDELYRSKKAFFQGEENKVKENDYFAYYYYQKVIEKDFYYNIAKNYVTEYIEDELAVFKENVNNILNVNTTATNEEKLEIYYEGLKYLKENKVANNIDLSSTEEYQKLYDDIVSKITETTKLIVENLSNNLDYNKCLEVINKTLENLDNTELKEYEELTTLKENFEEKKPESLLERDVISKTPNSTASELTRVINNNEYTSYIAFKVVNSTESRVYNLNKEYKTFKTSIIKENESDNINGVITIYGDDIELYRLDNIETTPNIEIDVSEINTLKIEFKADKESLTNDFNIYLVEPYLYK